MTTTAYEAANGLEAHMIADLLKQEGIEAEVSGQHLQGAVGELPAAGLVRVLVEEDQYLQARAIIQRWESTDVGAPTAPVRPRKRWPAFLAGLLLGVGATWAVTRVPSYENGYDHNGDGILDEKWIYGGNRAPQKWEADRNLDGKIDITSWFDDRGRALRSESDDDFDGKIDTRVNYRLNQPQVSSSDTNGDGFEDMRTHFRGGVIDTIEYLEPKTGRVIKRDFLKIGRTTHAEIDTDGDGKMDRRVTYDAILEPVKTEPIAR